MAIKLLIDASHERLSSTSHELDQSLITFGRSKSCHIELDNPEVSRRHFIIKFIDNVYNLYDEGSRHGTILDGRKLEPCQVYPIGPEHVIEVPGYTIKLFCDGQKPKLERTTVVARKLLDELLQDRVGPRECPSLSTKDSAYHFKFIDEKTSFVLGRLPHVDFPVSDPLVAKEHVSFVRDINGIRLNPLPGYAVFINGLSVTDPQILTHGSVITVGDIELIYSVKTDRHEREPLPIEEERHNEVKHEITPEKPLAKGDDQHPLSKIDKPLVKILDRFFVLAFFLALAGASALFFELI